MNKHIENLYNQCFVMLEHDTPNTGFDFNRFAELIVAECAQVADEAEPYQTSDLILKHFGVKQ